MIFLQIVAQIPSGVGLHTLHLELVLVSVVLFFNRDSKKVKMSVVLTLQKSGH